MCHFAENLTHFWEIGLSINRLFIINSDSLRLIFGELKVIFVGRSSVSSSYFYLVKILISKVCLSSEKVSVVNLSLAHPQVVMLNLGFPCIFRLFG